MHLHTCIYERTHMMISVKAWVRRAVSNFCVPTVRAWPSWNFQNQCSWTPVQVRQEPGAVIPCKSCKRMCCCKSIHSWNSQHLTVLPWDIMEWHKDSVNSSFLHSPCWTCAFSHILEHCSSIVHLQLKAQIPRACLPVLSFSKQDFATSARVQVQLWTKNSDPFYFFGMISTHFCVILFGAYVFRFQIIYWIWFYVSENHVRFHDASASISRKRWADAPFSSSSRLPKTEPKVCGALEARSSC